MSLKDHICMTYGHCPCSPEVSVSTPLVGSWAFNVHACSLAPVVEWETSLPYLLNDISEEGKEPKTHLPYHKDMPFYTVRYPCES